MASPVSIGDAIAIVTQICHLYDAYRSTPNKLRQILQGFKDVERELETLNSVLANSRRAEHRTYPYTAALVSDLSKARDYFQRFEPLVDEEGTVSMITKVKGAVRVKWDDVKVRAHVARMNVHRDNMKDFKQTVLIQAAQDNIELQISAIQLQLGRTSGVAFTTNLRALTHDDASSTSSDQMSVLTKASKSLSIIDRLEPAPSTQLSIASHSVLESNMSIRTSLTDSSHDLRRTIADYVERKELYRLSTLQHASLQELQYVAELPQRWLQLQRDGHTQSVRSDTRTSNETTTTQPRASYVSSALPLIPPATANTNDHPGTTGLIPDLRVFSPIDWSVDQGPSSSVPPTRPASDPILDAELSSVGDTISSNDSDLQDDELTLHDSVMLFTPWTKDVPIPCTLTLIQSASSLTLRSTTKQLFHWSTISALGDSSGIALSPVISRRSSISTVTSEPGMQPLVFDHAVLGGMRSFPRILHPRVEPKMAHSHPFAIEFYTPQFLSLKGDDYREKNVRGVAYQFRGRSDRDLVRARVFGKELLASTGITTIQFDRKSATKPCGTEAVSLWTMSATDHENLTITIQCSTKGKPEPDCAQEFIVLKAKGLEKARDEQNRELTLTLRPAPLPPIYADEEAAFTCSADVHGGGSSSGASYVSETGTSPQSRRSSILSYRRLSISSHVATGGTKVQDIKAFQCFIKFSEGMDGLTSSKRKFLNALQAHLSG